jgi:hypothetical protein
MKIWQGAKSPRRDRSDRSERRWTTSASGAAGGLGLLILAAGPTPSLAQSASSTLSPFSKGFSGGPSTFETPVDVSTQSSGGGTTFVNGVMQAPSGSLFANLTSLGAPSTSGGVAASNGSSGAAGAAPGGSGFGGALNVVAPSDNHGAPAAPAASRALTPASGETGAGAASAPLVLNGKVNLDGGQ